MACIGVISAMWLEAQLLREQMREVECMQLAGMKYYAGKIGGTDVVLSTCGVGKVNAALFTQQMIDRFQVDAIIHTGIAGSMDERAGHLDVVIARELTFYDVRPEQLRGCYPFQEFFRTDEALSRLIQEQAGGDALAGLVITGDDFIAESEKKARLKARFPQALCVEMEGCAIANAAYVNGVPIAVVRCISDMADQAAEADYRAFEQKAANRAAEIVSGALRRMNGQMPDSAREHG